MPLDLNRMIGGDAEAKRFFDGLSYSKKQWFVLSVEGAKTPETRQRRIDKAVEMLRASRDLVAVTGAARSEGVTVALVEQLYRVAGRRAPAPARQLDAAWASVVDQLLAGELRGLQLVVGGRSSGARVACRTAEATGAADSPGLMPL